MAKERTPLWKIVLFSLLPLVALAVVAELGLRVAYFQAKSENKLALTSFYNDLKTRLSAWRAEHLYHTGSRRTLGRDLVSLYRPEGAELLASFKKTYEQHFQLIEDECKRIGSRLIVAHIPGDDFTHSASVDDARAFYADLTRRHRVEYIDLTPTLLKYDVKAVTLLPENGHLSRFGNRLVAQAIAELLAKHASDRSSFHFDSHPALFGDLKPNDNSVWLTHPALPFRVITNGQGLRMEHELTFPKTRQRILLLGDSMTFGAYVSQSHTYPHFLEGLLPDREFVNAGVSGYSIVDEASLFLERARYVEPDITVLEVIDNDVSGLFYFLQDIYDRKHQLHAPTEQEKAFFDRIKGI